ncbi:hypothetical protein Tco_0856224 [Tanacetum coccineum]
MLVAMDGGTSIWKALTTKQLVSMKCGREWGLPQWVDSIGIDPNIQLIINCPQLENGPGYHYLCTTDYVNHTYVKNRHD